MELDIHSYLWRCSCGGLLDLLGIPTLDNFKPVSGLWSIWRYRKSLPFDTSSNEWETVTLGEGITPLIEEEIGQYLKLDFLMPTLSFKDRGSAVLITKALELGVSRVVADSSGNAGISIAAYCSRAAIDAEVFVPANTSGKKVEQLRSYGAKVHQVTGDRQAANAAAIEYLENNNAYYASHIYNPLFHHGTKTYMYEIWEQLGGKLPDVLVLPVGNGTLLLGAYIGAKELVDSGLASRMPNFIAIQARECAPLASTWQKQTTGIAQGESRCNSTVAEGIAIADPPRANQMIEAVNASRGSFVTVSEAEIISARRLLSRRGIDVEPTAAAAYAGFLSWRKQNPETGSIVVALTGAGLKSAPSNH